MEFNVNDILVYADPSSSDESQETWQVIEVLENHIRLTCINTYNQALLPIGTSFAESKSDAKALFNKL